MIEFEFQGDKGRLTKVVSNKYPSLSYNHLRSLLRNKDVKVNGKRIKEDVEIEGGDLVQIYTTLRDSSNYEYHVDIVYEDENLFVFNKPKGLETEGDISLLSYAKTLCPTSCAVHRLDVNTNGVILVAKNEKIGELLSLAIKERQIEKYYLSAVYGKVDERARLTAYLVKDGDRAEVKIYDRAVLGGLKIVTEYERLFLGRDFSIVKIHLLTGRTHQIRAHMAHIGHQVLGDGKYGRREINSRFSYKKQALTAYRLEFNTTGELGYLRDKVIEIETEFSTYL